jgi:RNA recognition motif. (a.k.a. RRM, RBD, or RNP domain)
MATSFGYFFKLFVVDFVAMVIVVQVKFLKTKSGCAMVQMGDGSAVERVLNNLNGTYYFGSRMQLG